MRLVAAGWSISSHLPQESPGASCFEWSRRGFASILADQGDPYQPVLWAETGAGISRQRHTPPSSKKRPYNPTHFDRHNRRSILQACVSSILSMRNIPNADPTSHRCT
jgi:hypothetical protein